MRTTIDAAGRLVIPRALRERVGLSVPAAVDVIVDGASIRVEPVVGAGFVEEDGILVIPPTGTTITNAMILELRDGDRRWPRD
jgi:bifunctional DNA-binding transcriptional regulator/antitoxin component of YhaV-PrlF toxin-antitoxin module